MPRKSTEEKLQTELVKLQVTKNRLRELQAKEKSENVAKERKEKNKRFLYLGYEIERRIDRSLTDEDVERIVANVDGILADKPTVNRRSNISQVKRLFDTN